jgi:RIO kinase 1
MPGDLFPADWLETFEYEETVLGALKSGKESEVYLVARSAHGRTSLMAEKRFLAREHRSFDNTYTYAGIWGSGSRHESRAMKKNTRYGQEHRFTRWVVNEWANLVHLYDAGVTVPPPVGLVEDGVLCGPPHGACDGYRMAFIGDGLVAAPRLSSVDLDRSTAARVWDELIEDIARMLAAERVHGDLSAYNVLWWRERAVLIDFSQSVEIVTHPAARDLLVRDITSLGSYFKRRGVVVDVDAVLARIGADDRLFTHQAMRMPPPRRD